jgi:hypothetical protein
MDGLQLPEPQARVPNQLLYFEIKLGLTKHPGRGPIAPVRMSSVLRNELLACEMFEDDVKALARDILGYTPMGGL